MKKQMFTIAIGGTVVAFILSCVVLVQVDEVRLTATMLEHAEYSSKQLAFVSLPTEEEGKVQASIGSEVARQDVVSFHIFPEIEDSAPVHDPAETFPAHCPFTETDTEYVIDFTRKGTTPLQELALVANRRVTDAQKNSDPVLIDGGAYTVHLASFIESGAVEAEYNFEQQWYLEFYDEKDAVVRTTPATRDVPSDEVGVVVELVERGVVLSSTVTSARALHTAYPNTEPQTVIPLCARLTLEDIAPEENLGQSDEVGGGERTLFTAATFLQNTGTAPHDYTFLFTLGVLLTLLCSIVVLVISPSAQKS